MKHRSRNVVRATLVRLDRRVLDTGGEEAGQPRRRHDAEDRHGTRAGPRRSSSSPPASSSARSSLAAPE